MYRMILADDETATRAGLRTAVNWKDLGVSIVGEASDGYEALSLLERTAPDIFICDIRMPKLDGITLLNRVRGIYPDMQVIFLSGYSDKDYLRSALRLEAVDYIYKPFDLEELIGAVRKCIRRIGNAHTSAEDETAALRVLRENIPIPFPPEARIVSVRIQIRSVQEGTDGLMTTGKSPAASGLYRAAFRETARQIFGDSFLMSEEEQGYLLHAAIPPGRDLSSLPLERLLAVLPADRFSAVVGAGGPGQGIGGLRKAAQQAETAVGAAFLLGYDRVIFPSDFGTAPFTDEGLAVRFGNVLDKEGPVQALAFCESVFASMRTVRPGDIGAVRDTLVTMLTALYRRLPEVRLAEAMETLPDLEHFRAYFSSMLTRLSRQIEELSGTGYIVYKAQRFIHAHLQEELSIAQIAAEVFVTPNYLSYLFKSATGKTVHEYVLSCRMQYARTLLETTDLTVAEVAQKVGYPRAAYFSRQYEKYNHQKPLQTRRSRME